MKTKLLILALSLLTLSVMAQRRKPVPLTPEQQEQLAKIERMTANTQKVIIIDSVVVDKEQLLNVYQLNPEAGRVDHYQNLFHSEAQPQSYVNINGLGNRCYLSLKDAEGTSSLYASEVADHNWTTPKLLEGINDSGRFTDVNFPYMMGDGQTFYFAAQGSEGLGGYDIYVTRYDAEEKSFLHPVNLGMPFNSEANDFLYVIDEYSNLGWFATDRSQEEGKVCVYTFIPPTARKSYSTDDYTDEEIASFARIDRIADTWSDSTAVNKALSRLQQVTQHNTTATASRQFQFVINDNLTYYNIDEFRAPGNANRYKRLTELYHQSQMLTEALEQARTYYATASQRERDELRPEILASEQKQRERQRDIKALEKEIRNSEIIFLTKNN